MAIDFNNIENRWLEIRNFRNLGPFCTSGESKSNDDKAFVKIKRSLDKEVVGGLIQLIGVNNSGKSNVLDAFERYFSQEFEESDYTDFTLVDRAIEPYIGINLANGKYKQNYEVERIKYSGNWNGVLAAFLLEWDNYELFLDYSANRDASFLDYLDFLRKTIIKTFNSEVNKEFLDFIKYVFEARDDLDAQGIYFESVFDKPMPTNNGYARPIESYDFRINNEISIESSGNHISDYIFNRINEHHTDDFVNDSSEDFIDSFESMRRFVQNVDVSYQPKEEVVLDCGDGFAERYGYVISDVVYKYKQTTIRSSDLSCNPEEPNQFFKDLLQSLGYSPKVLENSYSGNKNLRHKLAKEINKQLESVSDELNDLLNINEKKYRLSIVLESNNMEFVIEYGKDIPLNLDRQSQGFKWLFDLYFTLLSPQKFEPGDMILIDEFGDSLGFSTVSELTRKLRDYGRKNGITFILATQNPMAIDINHLDEVRLVVPKDDGSSVIINEFDHFGDTDKHDVLLPILSGLMVSRNFMRTEDRRTVFVEGVTDYFYLNAFAESLRNQGKTIDIDFIPMRGLGPREEDPRELIKQMLSIEREPLMLIDSDGKGKAVRKAIEKDRCNRITVADIGEIFDGKKEIEDLFSRDDAERFCISKDKKGFDEAFCVGYTIQNHYDSLSEETKDNFTKAIDYVLNM